MNTTSMAIRKTLAVLLLLGGTMGATMQGHSAHAAGDCGGTYDTPTLCNAGYTGYGEFDADGEGFTPYGDVTIAIYDSTTNVQLVSTHITAESDGSINYSDGSICYSDPIAIWAYDTQSDQWSNEADVAACDTTQSTPAYPVLSSAYDGDGYLTVSGSGYSPYGEVHVVVSDSYNSNDILGDFYLAADSNGTLDYTSGVACTSDPVSVTATDDSSGRQSNTAEVSSNC